MVSELCGSFEWHQAYSADVCRLSRWVLTHVPATARTILEARWTDVTRKLLLLWKIYTSIYTYSCEWMCSVYNNDRLISINHNNPNSITPTLTKTSPQGKLWTQIMKVTGTNGDKSWTMKFRWKSPTQITKVADINHLDMSRCLRQSPWQVRDQPVYVALMKFGPLQCMGKVGDKVQDKFPSKSQTCCGHKSWKSATWFVLRTFMICVRDFVGNLSRTLSQSQHNGI